ncbi:Ldh family oxidoreductase [Conexibacter woesei]|uniref:Malate/L-lactate dehydrogenase n=1 Tax=Conexibacter woesei (strain DSM 14684 / CCUG 47730 / CIP 108061 / JCM 11494 / NBRC 100937 / ID131577) TaxID=469383 RepID=D3F3F0_CONWI|nr:Ldh family oxidoreductase [Conexibacter woesei]ADB52315.1 Malate/L-lactate dehydrogenase [Conexibacter woesei DSM 14684]
MSGPTHTSPSWLVERLAAVFSGAGLPAAAARTVATALVDADMRGIPSHGSLLVPMYVERIVKGSVATATEPATVADLGAVAVLDAGHALGVISADTAMALAIEKARAHGLGAVAVRHAFHFGGAFRYVQAAADAGMVGVAAANTRPLMPAPGGAHAVVGNNPLAVGVPRAGGEPLVLDMALSEAALGKIRLAAQEGRAIPATWATDADGAPTTDPVAAIAGLLLPAAGHKGYGLALIVDVLTGVLSGGAFGRSVNGLYADTGVPNDCAHFFLALDVARFAGDLDTFSARVAELSAQVTSPPTAPGVERLLVPGQLEAERHAAAREQGVALDATVLARLRETAASVGVELGEPPVHAAAVR